MRPERDENLSADLQSLLGDQGFLALVENFGGQRVYIPATGDTPRLVDALGVENAVKLARSYSGGRLHVPLAREFRARQYRLAGLKDVEIAQKLVITVSALERMFQRMPDRPRRSKPIDPRQLKLFEA